MFLSYTVHDLSHVHPQDNHVKEYALIASMRGQRILVDIMVDIMGKSNLLITASDSTGM